ncbi:uncharacterized protein [Chelonus insularis]|uniref:uncharacterized protein n=1 Tax=Chelonus insularis TaxID=460826 RepID=UPI00158DC1B9|nr:uncharacterized protein LOC118071513 [Chelonus insularis]
MKVHLILTVAFLATLHAVMGYPQHLIVSPDTGAVVPGSDADHEDLEAAASETGVNKEYEEDDDTDMFMEPDGAETTNVQVKKNAEVKTESTVVPTKEETRMTVSVSSKPAKKEEEEEEASVEEDKSLEQESQNFFPSFAELIANHRLLYNDQQQRYRPNRFLGGYFQRDRSAPYQAASSSTKDTQHSLLGSGNFGVIRGGTYYSEDKESESDYSIDDSSIYNPYYSASVGRARANNYYKNPKPQSIRSNADFFANFRDFADITAPPKSSFSHLSIVYANRNSTKEAATEPRNIIETLRMLEQQEDDGFMDLTTTTEIPEKKLSKGKRKLLKMKKYHEDKTRKFRINAEPLLALS